MGALVSLRAEPRPLSSAAALGGPPTGHSPPAALSGWTILWIALLIMGSFAPWLITLLPCLTSRGSSTSPPAHAWALSATGCGEDLPATPKHRRREQVWPCAAGRLVGVQTVSPRASSWAPTQTLDLCLEL